jgi:hypothetical protein
MVKSLIALAIVGGICVLGPTSGRAEPFAHVMAGDPAGRNVDFIFDVSAANGSLRIATHRVGNPGARLSIWIDHSRVRLFSRILTADDCKYGDDGAQCSIAFKGEDHRRFVAAFKRGKTAHIEVENAAVMQMSSDISLIGVRRKLRST